MNSPRPLRFFALAAGFSVALTLGGCVTLLPKTEPAQLYRFDVSGEASPQSETQAAGFWVYRAPTSFARGAEGDQILTLNGDQVAYIAGARWVAPAAALFDEAESHAFDRSSGPAHLNRRGEVGNGLVNLRLDVEAFESSYLDGPGNPPTVVVQVRASLSRVTDRQPLATHMFESRRKVDSNRLGAIVPGFNGAVTDVLGQVVAWTDAEGSKAVAAGQASPLSASTGSATARPGP